VRHAPSFREFVPNIGNPLCESALAARRLRRGLADVVHGQGSELGASLAKSAAQARLWPNSIHSKGAAHMIAIEETDLAAGAARVVFDAVGGPS
jgi:hypothetical protein